MFRLLNKIAEYKLDSKRLILLSFFTLVLFFTVNGTTVGIKADDCREIPDYIRAIDKTLYANDYVFKKGGAFQTTIYYYLIKYLGQFINIYFLSMILNVAFKFMLIYLLFKIINEIFKVRMQDALLWTALFVFASYLRGNFINLFSSHDDILFIFLLLTLFSFLKGKSIAAFIFTGCAFNFHALYSILFFIGITIAFFLRHNIIKKYFKCVFLFVLFSLPIIILNLADISYFFPKDTVLPPGHPFNYWEKFMRVIHLDFGLIKILWHDFNIHLITLLVIIIFFNEVKKLKLNNSVNPEHFRTIGAIFIPIFIITIFSQIICEFFVIRPLAFIFISIKGRDLMRPFLLFMFFYLLQKNFKEVSKKRNGSFYLTPRQMTVWIIFLILLDRQLFFLGSLAGFVCYIFSNCARLEQLKSKIKKKHLAFAVIGVLALIKFIPWAESSININQFPGILIRRPFKSFTYLIDRFFSLSYLAANSFIYFPLLLILLFLFIKFLRQRIFLNILLAFLSIIIICQSIFDGSIYVFVSPTGKIHAESFNKKAEAEVKNYLELQIWVRQNIDKDAVLLTPPYLYGFRVYSQRAIFLESVDWGFVQITNDENLSWEYWNRVLKLVPSAEEELKKPLAFVEHFKPVRPLALGERLEENYKNLSIEQLEEIVKEYNINYVVFETKFDQIKYLNSNDYFLVFKNERFTVYKVAHENA